MRQGTFQQEIPQREQQVKLLQALVRLLQQQQVQGQQLLVVPKQLG